VSAAWPLHVVPSPDEILRRGEGLREQWAQAGKLVIGPIAYCEIHDRVFFFACPGIGHKCCRRVKCPGASDERS
jgi:hypothetical protein